jgi:hypothetical protein
MVISRSYVAESHDRQPSREIMSLGDRGERPVLADSTYSSEAEGCRQSLEAV